MFHLTITSLVALLLSAAVGRNAHGATLDQNFTSQVRPLLERLCIDCHSSDTPKGDLDLEPFTSAEKVLKSPKAWEKVVEQVSLGEMPPKNKKQPSGEEREQFLSWVNSALDEAARARAGDPGPVILRRLNNAEYTYTLRDLTGVDSLSPAREFPPDSAAGEGFMNTGASLVMSPSMVTKYLDAAKDISTHAVLLPDGFRFSPGKTKRDWTDELLAQIRQFYARYTTSAGGEKVNLQGIIFDTNEGGRLPVERYLAATLKHREHLSTNLAAFADIAREEALSPKYLRILWDALNDAQSSLMLDDLRKSWRGAAADPKVISEQIQLRQKALWKFSSVGHIGKAGGPKAWMEPVNPIVTNLQMRLKIPSSSNEVTLYLAVTDAGDGNNGDSLRWSQPRYYSAASPAQVVPAPFQAESAEKNSLVVHAPSLVEIKIPADRPKDCEFAVEGSLAEPEGSVQLLVTTNKPTSLSGLISRETRVGQKTGLWTSDTRQIANDAPILVTDGSAAQRRILADFDAFRALFPSALCYPKIVPVDEVVTLTLFYREDHHLSRLMLSDEEAAQLDRLWDELHFVSEDALKLVDMFEQIWQFATQDADPKVFEPMRKPILDGAARFRERLVASEPHELESLIQFAGRAYRKPLAENQANELRAFYRNLRSKEIPHEDAFRATLARVFVAPAFLYRLEKSPAGAAPAPVSDHELATRLSYFLWSSAPDPELASLANAGTLRDLSVLQAQARSMLKDPRIRRLSVEFASTWLHIHDFDSLDEKSERHFPSFVALRGAMYEETLRFFTDLFQNDGSLLAILDSDYTFLNEDLAKHYGIPNVSGPEWRRVDGIKSFSRGGVLAQSTVLTKQSGASRTSPILRGNWISEVLLGERLPRPPKNVPQLPTDETGETLTVRQLVERHSSDPKCYGCHKRIDGYGFALEGFDAIGRARKQDLAERPVETKSTLFDGTAVDGFEDLRHYLATTKRDVILRQFCRKLLGFSLGRAIILSDKPLITEMMSALAQNEYRSSAAIDVIVRSPQFRMVRGADAPNED